MTDAEEIARRFHESYERLAPEFSYETRRESAVSWEDVPENNRALMIATVSEVLESLLAEQEELEAIIDQAGNTIDFLHHCLVSLDGYSYGYPEQTVRFLRLLRAVVPDGPFCVHSMSVDGCESCAEGERWRTAMARLRERVGEQ